MGVREMHGVSGLGIKKREAKPGGGQMEVGPVPCSLSSGPPPSQRPTAPLLLCLLPLTLCSPDPSRSSPHILTCTRIRLIPLCSLHPLKITRCTSPFPSISPPSVPLTCTRMRFSLFTKVLSLRKAASSRVERMMRLERKLRMPSRWSTERGM